MDPVYFSHGYREREAPFAEHFTLLMRSNGFLPSLDPPSEDVNSAKLEKHLGYTVGEISVISDRNGNVSPHILYEIYMCIKAKKPLLVFIEDTVRDGLVPDGILQTRFSGRSYVRQAPQHSHSIEMFRKYVGEKSRPKYGLSIKQRTCLIIGIGALGKPYKRSILKELQKRGYKIIEYGADDLPLIQTGEIHFQIASSSLALCCVDELSLKESYLLGVVQDAMVPSILITKCEKSPVRKEIPLEYQRRWISPHEVRQGMSTIRKQIDLFEEDFLDLDDSGDASTYANQLVKSASNDGNYTANTRERIIQEITMGDKNVVSGQIGAVGSNAHAHDINFNQIWNQSQNSINLTELSKQLSFLREKLHPGASSAEQHAAIGALANAEIEAKNGNGPEAMSWLAKSGKWAFDNATKVGVEVAAAAIKTALGI